MTTTTPSESHDAPSPEPTRTTGNGSASRWIGRALLLAIVVIGLVTLWPMAKGVYYGMVPPEPVPADQLPAWRESYEMALAESAQTGKPVLIDFTASWCPPCRVMEADVWPEEQVRTTLAERVIPLQLDVDDPSSAAAARRYNVQYIPTIVLVDATGEELAHGQFMSADDLVSFVEEHAPLPTPTQ